MTNYLAVSTDGPSAVSSYLASIPGVIMVWGGLDSVRSRRAALRARCQPRARTVVDVVRETELCCRRARSFDSGCLAGLRQGGALLSELGAGVLAIHASSSLRLLHRPIGLLGAGGGAGRRHMG